jgi:hypothetical protein
VDARPDGAAEGNDEEDNDGEDNDGEDKEADDCGVENVIEDIGIVDVGDAVVDGESIDVVPMLLDVVPIVEGMVGV